MNNLHLGIIPDGNRRYAKKFNISVDKSYFKGLEVMKNLIENIFMCNMNKYDIKILTIFVCSKDNLIKRSEKEINLIKNMINKFLEYCDKNKKNINNYKIKFSVAGNINLLNDQIIINKLLKLINETKEYNKYKLNLAIGYDGREEIKKATLQLNYNNEIITIDNIKNNLDVKEDIDMVIRTGYEKRMSGFFPWQTVYSEWFFLNKYWGELDMNDINKIYKKYIKRKRNFGK